MPDSRPTSRRDYHIWVFSSWYKEILEGIVSGRRDLIREYRAVRVPFWILLTPKRADVRNIVESLIKKIIVPYFSQDQLDKDVYLRVTYESFVDFFAMILENLRVVEEPRGKLKRYVLVLNYSDNAGGLGKKYMPTFKGRDIKRYIRERAYDYFVRTATFSKRNFENTPSRVKYYSRKITTALIRVGFLRKIRKGYYNLDIESIVAYAKNQGLDLEGLLERMWTQESSGEYLIRDPLDVELIIDEVRGYREDRSLDKRLRACYVEIIPDEAFGPEDLKNLIKDVKRVLESYYTNKILKSAPNRNTDKDVPYGVLLNTLMMPEWVTGALLHEILTAKYQFKEDRFRNLLLVCLLDPTIVFPPSYTGAIVVHADDRIRTKIPVGNVLRVDFTVGYSGEGETAR